VQPLEQWTQLLEPGTVDTAFVATAFVATAFGHSLCGRSFWTQPCGALRKWRVEVRIRPYNSATFIDFDSFLLQAPEYLQDSNDTQDMA